MYSCRMVWGRLIQNRWAREQLWLNGMKNIADLRFVMKVLWRDETFLFKPVAIFIHENYNNMRNCKLGRDVCLSSKDNVGGRWLSLRTKIKLYYGLHC